jgi:hypothetical protein
LKARIVLNQKPKIEFTAKIKQVNMKGLMTVQFSEKIAEPANYTIFNEDFLQFKIVSSEEAKEG